MCLCLVCFLLILIWKKCILCCLLLYLDKNVSVEHGKPSIYCLGIKRKVYATEETLSSSCCDSSKANLEPFQDNCDPTKVNLFRSETMTGAKHLEFVVLHNSQETWWNLCNRLLKTFLDHFCWRRDKKHWKFSSTVVSPALLIIGPFKEFSNKFCILSLLLH